MASYLELTGQRSHRIEVTGDIRTNKAYLLRRRESLMLEL
jgi:hypothetical protein